MTSVESAAEARHGQGDTNGPDARASGGILGWLRRHRRCVRRTTVAVLVIGGFVLISGTALGVAGCSRINRQYALSDLPAISIDIPSSETESNRGKRLAAIVGCNSCHSDDLGGEQVEKVPGVYFIYGPNLTSGTGGVGKNYLDADWLRAIRHGVRPDGSGLVGMPADYYQSINGTDLGALIAYLKTVPPVDRDSPPTTAEPIGMALVGMGLFGEPVAAQLVDHSAPVPTAIPVSTAPGYGAYLVSITNCAVCHGERLTGAKTAGHAAAPDITAGGNVGRWSLADFRHLLRTGLTPEGRVIDVTAMPWDRYLHMTDEEIEAVYLYLQTLGDDVQ